MKNLISIILLLFLPGFLVAQDVALVKKLDELRDSWKQTATEIKSFEGLSRYCSESTFRIETTELLNEIHHYDSVLLKIVQEKYEATKDEEARLTLEDIEKLEIEYKTGSFKQFLRKECSEYNAAEQNKAYGEYDSDKKRIEKELASYIQAITRQIDLVDEHAHHLAEQ